jgi:hypothetical protein
MEIQDFAQNVTSIPLDPFPPVKCQPYYKVGLKKIISAMIFAYWCWYFVRFVIKWRTNLKFHRPTDHCQGRGHLL